MTGAISLAIFNNYDTNNFAFGKHLGLTLDELNISSLFIQNHLLGNHFFTIKQNPHHPVGTEVNISVKHNNYTEYNEGAM